MSDGKWICLTVSSDYKHGKIPAVQGEIRNLFGTDLIEIRVVNNESLFSSGAYYCLVSCRNYGNHIQQLKVCTPDIVVLDSAESPRYLTMREVKDFVASSNTAKEQPIRCGDVVLVTDGYLKNLYGLVCRSKGKRYCISFKTHLRTFTETIASKSVKVVGNFFHKKKFPVLLKKDVKDEVCTSNIHRQENRECAESKVCG